MSKLEQLCAALRDVTAGITGVTQQLEQVGKRLRVSAARTQVAVASESAQPELRQMVEAVAAAAYACQESAVLLLRADQVAQAYITANCADATTGLGGVAIVGAASSDADTEEMRLEKRMLALASIGRHNLAASPIGEDEMLQTLLDTPSQVLGQIASVTYKESPNGKIRGCADGYYNAPDRMPITLYPLFKGDLVSEGGMGEWETMTYTLNHEVGHVLHMRILSREQREEWQLLFFESREANSGFVSEYAQRNDEDDFGESFATYRSDPRVLKFLAPKKYEFIDKVFRGLEAGEVGPHPS
jgi:hypothetical protein